MIPIGEEGTLLGKNLFIEPNLGIKGRIRFIEVPPLLISSDKPVFPAGPALPILLDITLEELTMQGLATVGFNLGYGKKKYTGMGDYDSVKFIRDESAALRFWTWIEDDVTDNVQPLFPRAALEGIDYTLTI